MPIYEYRCRACEARFEEWVRKEGMTPAACPGCGSDELERMISSPSVHSDATREKGRAAARKRDARLGKEREIAQREYELSHND
ncbi:MAG TPA: zinc ribbon domain-containing protein [Longimicrobiales bacterium]|nr:zinc ribbon domain-containing protein [Longimicrobiales bacterium]